MKISIKLLAIGLFCFSFTSKEIKLKDTPTITIYGIFDGKKKQVEKNNLAYCYDIENLEKIEIVGELSEPKISFVALTSGNKKEVKFIQIGNKITIDMTKDDNLCCGGKMTIKNKEVLVTQFSIEYEGCQ
jgi:hypothetical protein